MEAYHHAGPNSAILIRFPSPVADSSPVTMSEKYDGINATWDGAHLVSRDGNRFDAPAWFTAGLPAVRLVGELWAGRGQFEVCQSIVKSGTGIRWNDLLYLIFEGPAGVELGDWARHVKQLPRHSQTHEDAFYNAVLARGGEGIVLRDPDGTLTKRKPIEDADARVIGHVPGRGKHSGRLGALEVEDADGRRFRLGTGFTDSIRESPPRIGAIVKYTFRGRTAGGVPRFASFAGVRAEAAFV